MSIVLGDIAAVALTGGLVAILYRMAVNTSPDARLRMLEGLMRPEDGEAASDAQGLAGERI